MSFWMFHIFILINVMFFSISKIKEYFDNVGIGALGIISLRSGKIAPSIKDFSVLSVCFFSR